MHDKPPCFFGGQPREAAFMLAPLIDPVGKLGTISIINSRILSMTTAATTTCNSNILDVVNSMMNENK
jgi:hypothetical protein